MSRFHGNGKVVASPPTHGSRRCLAVLIIIDNMHFLRAPLLAASFRIFSDVWIFIDGTMAVKGNKKGQIFNEVSYIRKKCKFLKKWKGCFLLFLYYIILIFDFVCFFKKFLFISIETKIINKFSSFTSYSSSNSKFQE